MDIRDKTELEMIKRLELDTLDSALKDMDRFEAYQTWVRTLSKEELRGVILGCLGFRMNNSNARRFYGSKSEKKTAEFKVEIANIYLAFAKDLFYCAYMSANKL